MSRKELSLEEKQKIKDSLKTTKERRKNQTIKVFELKVNCHHTSKETFKELNDCFKQCKWVYNNHKEIVRFDKDGNKIKETITLPVVYHRGIVKQVKTNISNLSKSKKKGNKIGKLKYVSEINSIPIITGFIKIKFFFRFIVFCLK